MEYNMNPFILSTYYSPEYFCDREYETARLISAFENNRNTTLISQRRMGKTGLLKHLQYMLAKSKDNSFIYFDIMTCSSAAEFVNQFANALFNSNNSKLDSIYKKFLKAFAAFKPSFSVNPMTGETKFNLELSNNNESEQSLATIFNYISDSKKKYLIAIDEFQQISSFGEYDFESVLRSYIQHLNNAVFIYSGSSRELISSMFTDNKKPFYMSSEIMHLDTINSKIYSDFIVDKFNKASYQISYKETEYLLNLVKTHTYYVQLLCNRLYSEGIKQINIQDINLVYSKILDENKFYFENYHNILTEYQWLLLKAIAKEGEASEITSKDFIRRHSLGSASSISTAIKSLEKKEIVFRENGKYMLHDLMFSSWLAR